MAIGIPGAVVRTGTAEASNGAADATLLAAPGANKITRLYKGIINVTVAAVGGSGEVALEDGAGGTSIVRIDADVVGSYPFDFGPRGVPLTANTLLNLTVDGAVTTQATAQASVTAYEVG